MSLNWYLLQLQNYPISFGIPILGVNYTMTVYWNTSQDAGWEFDLENADTSTPLVAGIPFITGSDLLAGLEYLRIGGSFYVYTNGMPDAVPTYTNLGSDCNLYFVTSETT